MTDMRTFRAYGLWDSPITPASVALSRRLGDVQWDNDGQTLVWLEGRSDRGVLVAQGLGDNAPRDLTEEHNVRAFVGYGGGDFTVSHGVVYYVEKESSRLYRLPLASGEPEPVTPAFGAAASPAVSADGRWLVYIHTVDRVDGLGIVDTAGDRWPQKLAFGADFYMQPAWHPEGKQLAWIEWNHPNMPWDGTRLVLGTLTDNEECVPQLRKQEVLLADEDVSAVEPQFTPDGRYLIYICDASGWYNLYRYDLQAGEHRPLTADQAEASGPAWVQGVRNYSISADGRWVFYTRSKDAFTSLWRVSVEGGEAGPVESPVARYTYLAQPAIAPQGSRLAVLAAASDIPGRVISVDLEEAAAERIHAHSTAERVPTGLCSRPEPVQWPASDGDTVHGLFYPPHNPAFYSSGKPPLIALVHGGPTGQVPASYGAQIQFLTTRGFAVLAVNYRGSTGYGKEYMKKLRGNWGLHDVEDTVGGAQHMVDTGRADPERLVVMGGSAGGFTTLLCLIQHAGFFRAGVCLFGVSNLFTLAADTHKFEERYLDSMVGPLPEASALYRERSAVFHADKIQDPIAVFQGEIDRVVPKDQSETIVESLRRRGVPHEYHLYPGEGHGWRKSETIEQYFTALTRFLRQYVIFS